MRKGFSPVFANFKQDLAFKCSGNTVRGIKESSLNNTKAVPLVLIVIHPQRNVQQMNTVKD